MKLLLLLTGAIVVLVIAGCGSLADSYRLDGCKKGVESLVRGLFSIPQDAPKEINDKVSEFTEAVCKSALEKK